MTLSTPAAPSTAATGDRARTALLLACGGTFLSFLDATVTNLAVPPIGGEFELGVTSLAWVVTAYAIPFAALLAPAGAVADAVGRVRLYLVGLAAFTVASLVATLAPTFGVLIGARAVQGIGAAFLVPASLGLLLAEIPAERRQSAIGVWSAVGALAAGVGPVLGGIGVQWLDWRVLFLVNVPMGLALLWVGRRLVEGETTGGRAPELLGSLLFAGAVAACVYAATEGPERDWDGQVWFGLAVGTVALLAVIVRSQRHPRPALRLDLLRGRTFATAAAVSVAYGAVLYGTMLLGVLLLTGPWSYSALEAGAGMTPCALVVAMVGLGLGRLRRKPAPRNLVVAGLALMSLSTGAISLMLSADPAFWSLWLPTGVLLGVGIGSATVGISSAAALSVQPVHFAAAIGLVMAARQFGGALGVAGLAVVLESAAPGAAAFAWIYLGAAALAFFAALSALGIRTGTQP